MKHPQSPKVSLSLLTYTLRYLLFCQQFPDELDFLLCFCVQAASRKRIKSRLVASRPRVQEGVVVCAVSTVINLTVSVRFTGIKFTTRNQDMLTKLGLCCLLMHAAGRWRLAPPTHLPPYPRWRAPEEGTCNLQKHDFIFYYSWASLVKVIRSISKFRNIVSMSNNTSGIGTQKEWFVFLLLLLPFLTKKRKKWRGEGVPFSNHSERRQIS